MFQFSLNATKGNIFTNCMHNWINYWYYHHEIDFFLLQNRNLLLKKIKYRKKNIEEQCLFGSSFVTTGHFLLQTVDRPKDWYKTMFKQIHMVHKPGMYVVLSSDQIFVG